MLLTVLVTLHLTYVMLRKKRTSKSIGYLSSTTMYSFIIKKKVADSISNWVILPAVMWLVFDPVWNRNEYQEYLLKGGVGSKSGRVLVLTTLPPSRVNCL